MFPHREIWQLLNAKEKSRYARVHRTKKKNNLQYSGGDDDAAETGTVFPVDMTNSKRIA